ncbi:hypothetical protein LQ327_11920 [Actinomycetospora endophytica]|uniref:Integrase-like protein n=1 Tax=Actinomycetospora endophytica TaxID=2291215 RepID=A0ABS8P9K5_9PSEU|nr:hypothetical protein [Actinomycetospora endophytica]MCD2194081.1 hypothetical protein [Actinomycetospora endophytica]
MAEEKRRPRRANGDGSIYQRSSDGKWVGSAYVYTSSGQVKRRPVYGSSYDDVRAKLDELKVNSAKGIPVPDRSYSVAQWFERWLATMRSERRPTTYVGYENAVRLYIMVAPIDTTAMVRNMVAPIDTTAMVRNMVAPIDTTAMVRNMLGADLTRSLAHSFGAIPVSDLLGVWNEAATFSAATPHTDGVLTRLQTDVPSLPPAALVGVIMCLVWLVLMGLLSSAAFENSEVAKEFISLTGLSPAFVSTALAGWSGYAVKQWQARQDASKPDD